MDRTERNYLPWVIIVIVVTCITPLTIRVLLLSNAQHISCQEIGYEDYIQDESGWDFCRLRNHKIEVSMELGGTFFNPIYTATPTIIDSAHNLTRRHKECTEQQNT